MGKLYIMYNSRTCVTGLELFNALKARNIPGMQLRRCNQHPPKTAPDMLLRWGNSIHSVPSTTIELNSQEAVRNTTDKSEMLRILSSANDVVVPQHVFNNNGDLTTAIVRELGLTDMSGAFFARDRHDHVHYGTNIRPGDKYVMKPIEKVHEYRVHVFNGHILGIYEKIPQNSSVKIYKNDTCEFRRIDQSNRDVMSGLKGLRPMAKAAVAALNLLFGGVDILSDANGNYFVTEVNTSPALNGPNLERWVVAIEDYLTSLSLSDESSPTTEQVNTPVPVQRTAPVQPTPSPEEFREVSRRNLTERVRLLVEQEGFAIESLVIS